MLAAPGDDVDAALAKTGPAAVEYKLDGARLQVHRRGDEVRAFTRSLDDITARVPEVVEAVLALPARELVLDGEAIALKPDGRPYPFQVTASRFGTRRADATAPLTPLFFDLLHVDGEDLIDRPGAERAAALDALVPAAEPRAAGADRRRRPTPTPSSTRRWPPATRACSSSRSRRPTPPGAAAPAG